MVASSVSFSSVTRPPAPQAQGDPTSRSLSEARRLINQHHIAGSKATRVLNLVGQAEQKIGEGEKVDAGRIARDALKMARETVDATGAPGTVIPTRPGEAAPGEENEKSAESDATPAEEALGVENSPIFKRETTNYADGSDDQGISFQYAQPLTQGQAFFAVKQHELSHVARDTREAILNGQRVQASAAVHAHIDPATGELHVSGGRSRIIIYPNIELSQPRRELLGENVDVKG